MPDREPSVKSTNRVIRRRRKCLACDACSKRKLRQQQHQISEPNTPSPENSCHSTPGFGWNPEATRTETPDFNLRFPGLALRSICVFNGLPFLSSGGRQWIKAQTGEDVDLNQYQPPKRISSLRPTTTRAIHLPSQSLLFQRFQEYKSSIFSKIFPFINPQFFEDTVREAYREQSSLTCSNDSAKACIFAFMAVTSMFFNSTDNHGNLDSDYYAYAAYDLVPGFFRESVTIEGLQALLMLCLYSQSVLGDQLGVELLFSTATRFVFHLGGHIFPKAVDVDEVSRGSVDLRLHIRNLFWLCYIFNQEYSLRTGLPPSLDDAHCDLTLCETATTDAQNIGLSGCSPLFIPVARMAIIQSQIYRRLYSVVAQNKTDAELLSTIRDLDQLLEEWKLSIPTDVRPSLTHRPTGGEGIPSSIFQLQYHYCMVTIHQVSGRCMSWTQDTRGLGSSLGISVEASRSLLKIVSHSELQIHRYNLLFCLPYVTAAMIHLFCDILIHPRDKACHANLELMDMARDRMLAQLWPQAPASFKMQVQFVKGLSIEVQRLARSAIRKAAV
ncbi:fungal transcription factor regulatory middle homology region [Aspergillus parasiticus SU-1]|uniref:Fungal transcription factor regulatory middle homology region n=1 Tax=Aspergillus parasiticus (strain ATCC 56775 / NRRL 5862 / SRRC 143 / SU-1) TaxID=1403190 RepID=A0A0F0I089_ASPPU|nr:fungal transcription factor regulatory middle homology region [Aspergillus parasiticus SU-1]